MQENHKTRTLNDHTMPELFTTPISWIADDTSAYRVILSEEQTSTGVQLKTSPIDGNCKIFNPKTGRLTILKIHSSLYEAKKRIGQLSKALSSHMILDFMNTQTPKEEKPDIIVSNRKGFTQILTDIFSQNAEKCEILGSDLYLNFEFLVKYIKKIKNKNFLNIFDEEEIISFDFYDAWLANVTPYTAFTRLMLIMKALVIDFEVTYQLLKNGRIGDYFWPSLDQSGWIELEMKLRNLILEDFVRQNENVDSVGELSNSQIRDVVFYDGFRDLRMEGGDN